jgi:hypothetical protein
MCKLVQVHTIYVRCIRMSRLRQTRSSRSIEKSLELLEFRERTTQQHWHCTDHQLERNEILTSGDISPNEKTVSEIEF